MRELGEPRSRLRGSGRALARRRRASPCRWCGTARPVSPGTSGSERTGPGGDHDVVGGDRLAGPGVDRARRRRTARGPRRAGHVRAGPAPATSRPAAEIGSILPKIRSRISRHRTPSRPGLHPEPVGVSGAVREIGGVDEHLGRDAADVEARAPEGALLQDRDVPVARRPCRRSSCRTRSRSRRGRSGGRPGLGGALVTGPSCPPRGVSNPRSRSGCDGTALDTVVATG